MTEVELKEKENEIKKVRKVAGVVRPVKKKPVVKKKIYKRKPAVKK